jgi:hypothetical protein
MVNRYAVLDEDDVVTTIALWDGETEWEPGATAVRLDPDQPQPEIGNRHIGNGVFEVLYPNPDPEAVPEQLVVTVDPAALDAARVAASKATTVKAATTALTALIDALAPQ